MSQALKKPPRLLRIFLFIGCALALVVFVALALGVGTSSSKKMVFSEIVTALGPSKSVVEDYIKSHNTLEGVERLESEKLPATKDAFQYLSISGGVLVGINYDQHVTVVLTPKLKDQSLHWQCYSSSKEATPLSCEGGL